MTTFLALISLMAGLLIGMLVSIYIERQKVSSIQAQLEKEKAEAVAQVEREAQVKAEEKAQQQNLAIPAFAFGSNQRPLFLICLNSMYSGNSINSARYVLFPI
jgi:hypothetical protein